VVRRLRLELKTELKARPRVVLLRLSAVQPPRDECYGVARPSELHDFFTADRGLARRWILEVAYACWRERQYGVRLVNGRGKLALGQTRSLRAIPIKQLQR